MTLFIACLIIHGLGLGHDLYVWACIIWILHLFTKG